MIDLEVLRLALSKEQNSIKLYQSLIADHANLKDLLYTLLIEEQKHKALIEKKIAELKS